MSTTTTTTPTTVTRHLKQVRATGRWEGQMRTRLQIRDFGAFHTDEPVPVGGLNQAPSPMEYVVAAVNGCLAVVIETVAKEHDIELSALELATTGTIDTRGFRGTADVSPHFQEVTVQARLGLSDPDALGFLLTEAERRCPALNLIRDAGVPVELDWAVDTTLPAVTLDAPDANGGRR